MRPQPLSHTCLLGISSEAHGPQAESQRSQKIDVEILTFASSEVEIAVFLSDCFKGSLLVGMSHPYIQKSNELFSPSLLQKTKTNIPLRKASNMEEKDQSKPTKPNKRKSEGIEIIQRKYSNKLILNTFGQLSRCSYLKIKAYVTKRGKNNRRKNS